MRVACASQRCLWRQLGQARGALRVLERPPAAFLVANASWSRQAAWNVWAQASRAVTRGSAHSGSRQMQQFSKAGAAAAKEAAPAAARVAAPPLRVFGCTAAEAEKEEDARTPSGE